MDRVFLVCKMSEDGDGYPQEESLKIFDNLDSAYKFCIQHFLSEQRKILFEENGDKKLIKLRLSVDDGVEKFRLIEKPKIYYDEYYLCLNKPDGFLENFVKNGKEYQVTEFVVEK